MPALRLHTNAGTAGPFAAAIVAVALFGLSSTVQAGEFKLDMRPVTVQWMSSADNYQQLSTDITKLYTALYNSQSLKVRTVPYEKGFLEDVVRANGVYVGAYYTQAVDDVLCDLNPKLCRRDLTPATPADLADITRHVGGYALSPTQWSAQIGDSIVVPDYSFTPLTVIEKLPVPKDWTADKVQINQHADCTSFGLNCLDLIQKLNPSNPFSTTDTQQSAILPLVVYSADIPISSDHASTLLTLKSRESLDPTPQQFYIPDAQSFTPQWNELVTQSQSDQKLLDVLEPRVVSLGVNAPFSVTDEPFFPDQEKMFKQIGHPYGAGQELPPAERRPIEILVLDGQYDPRHCDLPPSADNPVPTGAHTCGTLVDLADPTLDHGIGVVGMITAPENRMGIIGLNPYAKIVFRPIHFDLLTAADKTEVLMQLVLNTDARVANLSWGFPRDFGRIDMIQRGIEDVSKQTLVIVAAGNDNKHFASDGCAVMPACLANEDNVLTVVGLDGNEPPTLWIDNDQQGSNTSSAFGIGAIADKVFSTLHGGGMGYLSGTSVAAPQVAAAASLVFSAAEFNHPAEIGGQDGRLPPKWVKDRLLYTADFYSELLDDVWSGRLNITRATNINDAQVMLRGPGGTTYPVSGRLIKTPDAIACGSNAADNRPWSSVRRLTYLSGTNSYVILYNQNGADRNSPLIRENCNLATLSAKLTIVKADSSDLTVEFRDVADYTSPMFK